MAALPLAPAQLQSVLQRVQKQQQQLYLHHSPRNWLLLPAAANAATAAALAVARATALAGVRATAGGGAIVEEEVVVTVGVAGVIARKWIDGTRLVAD